jgi:hypothetical protein
MNLVFITTTSTTLTNSYDEGNIPPVDWLILCILIFLSNLLIYRKKKMIQKILIFIFFIINSFICYGEKQEFLLDDLKKFSK